MNTLSAIDAIGRFKDNEERVNTFANKTGSYATIDGKFVETLPSFLDRNDLRIRTRYPGDNYKGNFVAGQNYIKGDVARSTNGLAYLCVLETNGSNTIPENDGVHWRVWQGVTYPDLASSGATSLLGYQSALPGAIAQILANVLGETVSVTSFGAVGGGIVDITDAVNKAVLALALRGGGKLKFPYDSYKIAGKVVVPSNIEIDLGNSIIVGAGTGVGVMFETGYLSNGAIVSNIGTANEANLVQRTTIHSGTIVNCGTAFNVFNFIWNCAITRIQFENCDRNIVAKRSWYAKFHQLISLYPANQTNNPAFQFSEFVNVEDISSVFVTGRNLAYQFDGGINGLQLKNISAENCVNAVKFLGEVNPIEISSCYFEYITGTAIDMTGNSAHRAVTINNNWFFSCGTAIAGISMLDGLIGIGNYYSNCTNKVVINDDYNSYIVVEIPTNHVVGTSTPALPAGFTLGKKVKVVGSHVLFNGSTGLAQMRGAITNGLIDLVYTGNCGFVGGKVPFCTVTKSAGQSNVSLYVDTNISFNEYTFTVFKIIVSDYLNSYKICGRGYGSDIVVDVANGRTATISNNNGFLRLTLGLFATQNDSYGIEGILRIM